MNLFALLYVSKARLPADGEQGELTAIVRASIRRNATAKVTGALLFTGSYFAQWLEGEEAAVRSIMASIERDPRHADVTVIDEGPVDRRRFQAWSLSYSGRSTFAEVTAARAMEERDAFAARKLTRLLQELASSTPQAPSEA